MRYILGIDVSKSKLNYAVITDFGELVEESKIENNLFGFEQLKDVIKENNTEVIFEATGLFTAYTTFSRNK